MTEPLPFAIIQTFGLSSQPVTMHDSHEKHPESVKLIKIIEDFQKFEATVKDALNNKPPTTLLSSVAPIFGVSALPPQMHDTHEKHPETVKRMSLTLLKMIEQDPKKFDEANALRLIEAGADTTFAKDSFGINFGMRAAYRGYHKIVDALDKSGHKWDAVNSFKENTLHLLMEGYKEFLEKNEGASKSGNNKINYAETTRILMHSKRMYETTPLIEQECVGGFTPFSKIVDLCENGITTTVNKKPKKIENTMGMQQVFFEMSMARIRMKKQPDVNYEVVESKPKQATAPVSHASAAPAFTSTR